MKKRKEKGEKVTKKGNKKNGKGCRKGENCTMQKYWFVFG